VRYHPGMASLTLHKLSPRLVNELNEWARTRRKTPEAAAVELVRIGLDITSERVQKQTDAALQALQRMRKRHTVAEVRKRRVAGL
jgi:hypothetical protein